MVAAIVIHTQLLTVEQPLLRQQQCLCSGACALPAAVEACSGASPLRTCLALWTDLWFQGTASAEAGSYDVHIAKEISCWRASPLCQLTWMKRGDMPSPLQLCFWEKKE